MGFLDIFDAKKSKYVYRYMVCADNEDPEDILKRRKYLNNYNPYIEFYEGERKLILYLLSKSQLTKIYNDGFEQDQTITQFINDNKYIDGISDYLTGLKQPCQIFFRLYII